MRNRRTTLVFFLPATIHLTLDWLEVPELRRQATAELNKGDARNALARAIYFTASVACVIALPCQIDDW
ncbi:MAG TPA: Tn3 family transposase [Acetobacteraceae bacterium]|nr:Tn3 family transposase [Acetobacteraceae bacterium]